MAIKTNRYYFLLAISLTLLIPLSNSVFALYSIPPTNAFNKIHSSNGTIYAMNYSMPLTVKGSNGVTVTSSNKTHTLIITGSGSGSGTNQGTYNKTLANNVLVNSLGNRINLINGSNNPVKVVNDPTRNQVNITISSNSGSGSVTGSQNIGHGGQGVLASATSTTIRGKNVTSLRTDLITVSSSNSTDINLNSPFKSNTITCSSQFLSAFNNATGLYTCTTALNTAQVVNADNGESLVSSRFNATETKLMSLRNATAYVNWNHNTTSITPSFQFKVNNISCPLNQALISSNNSTGVSTCQAFGSGSGTVVTSQNIGKGTNSVGPLASPTATAIRGKNMTAGSRVYLSTNTTDNTIAVGGNQAANLTSTNGGGFGVLEGNANASKLNFRTLTSVNSNFLHYNRNTTSLSLNVTVPTNNVVDIYDNTIADYTQPTSATASSAPNNIIVSASQLFTYDKFNNTSGNVPDQCNNVGGTLCASDTGTQAVTGATLGVTGILNNAINYTGTTNRVNSGSSSEPWMHNQTATFSTNVWLKFDKSLTTACNNVGLSTCTIICDANNIAQTGVCLQMKITSASLMCPELIIYNGGNVATTSGGCIKSTTYDQNWHMYTFLFKYTNSTNQQCVGVDGGAFTCAAKNATAASNGAQSNNLFLGNRPAVDSSCLCAMDELSVYRTYILTRSQTITLYNAGVGQMIGIVGATFPASNAVDGNTATYWESQTETHPWIYVDTGTAQILTASALYWNSTSTCTQILIQTSADTVTWNTKRTTNTNLYTNQAWNFQRWDLDNTGERYVRFYCNDAGTKQLSFYELKVLNPTVTFLVVRHGHDFIDSTNATLGLSR